jgi:hypothetical protein
MTSPFLLVSTEVLCPSNWGVYIRTKGKHLMLWGPALCAASNFHSFDSFLSTFLGINILETKHTRQVPRCSNVSICLYPRLLSYVLIAHGHVPYMTIYPCRQLCVWNYYVFSANLSAFDANGCEHCEFVLICCNWFAMNLPVVLGLL